MKKKIINSQFMPRKKKGKRSYKWPTRLCFILEARKKKKRLFFSP